MTMIAEAILNNGISQQITPINKFKEAMDSFHIKSETKLFGFEPHTIMSINNIKWYTNIIRTVKNEREHTALVASGKACNGGLG